MVFLSTHWESSSSWLRKCWIRFRDTLVCMQKGAGQPGELCSSCTISSYPCWPPTSWVRLGPLRVQRLALGPLPRLSLARLPQPKTGSRLVTGGCLQNLGFQGPYLTSSDSKWPLTLMTSFNLEQFFIMPNGPPPIPVTLPDYPLTLSDPINLPTLQQNPRPYPALPGPSC